MKLEQFIILTAIFVMGSVSYAQDKAAQEEVKAQGEVLADGQKDAAQKPESVDEGEVAKEVKDAKDAKDAKEEPLSDLERAKQMIGQGKKAIMELKDFTAFFHKKEYLGKLLPEEVMLMKWRRNPRSVYMKWIGEEKKGQEVIWHRDKNEGKIHAHGGGILKYIKVNLDPDGSMAMKGNRHAIYESGFDRTGELISRDMNLPTKQAKGGKQIKALGTRTVLGAPSFCYEAIMDKANNPKFYGYKALICMDLKHKVPNRIQVWDLADGEVRLIEDYGYKDVRPNVGLTDHDFDPDNEAYEF